MTAHDRPDAATEVHVLMDGRHRDDCNPPTRSICATTSLQTRVTRADNGFEVSLDELMRTGEHPLLWSVDKRMRLTRRRATGRVVIRNRDVFRLNLASGRRLELGPGQ